MLSKTMRKICFLVIVLALLFAACDTGFTPANNGTLPAGGLGPRTEQADAVALRLLNLLLSDVEFDFSQINIPAATGIPIKFSCIVDTAETPKIDEIEESIKKGCGEWGLEGDKGIAAGGGIAVFVVMNGTGTLPAEDVVQWARGQDNLKSSKNTYAAETPEAEELQQIINEHCSGSTVEEKVRSVNRLLFDWFWYNVGGQRDAYTVLHGAKEYGAWGTQCEGYARSMVALLRIWDVKARFISGYAITYDGGPGGGGHAWVQVWNGAEWRMVDPTWNDPIISQPDSPIDPIFPPDCIDPDYINRWMMIKTINGDRVVTNSPKFHNARF
ncbi:MAG: hypothetical protein LBC72_04395 [Spirochaetaceae bacterium]|nr:hypothetical protein [Spirochaetaceae bacterium]